MKLMLFNLNICRVSEKDRTEFNEKENLFAEKLAGFYDSIRKNNNNNV